jgi:hypothetical protein
MIQNPRDVTSMCAPVVSDKCFATIFRHMLFPHALYNSSVVCHLSVAISLTRDSALACKHNVIQTLFVPGKTAEWECTNPGCGSKCIWQCEGATGVYRVLQEHSNELTPQVMPLQQSTFEVNLLLHSNQQCAPIVMKLHILELFVFSWQAFVQDRNATFTRRRWERAQVQIIENCVETKLLSVDFTKNLWPRIVWSNDEINQIAKRLGSSPNVARKLAQESKV